MICDFCKSKVLFLKKDSEEGKTGLYCKSCGRWLKWVSESESISIQQQIDKQKREISIDGLDVERVYENYDKYKAKYKALNDEIIYLKHMIPKTNSEIQKSAFYEKVLKLKELGNKVSAYDEIFTILGLKRSMINT